MRVALKQRLGDILYGGTPIWEFDWDVCCILDGCRVDTFREFYPDAKTTESVASSSKRWIRRTFEDYDTQSVAYITANPFADRLERADFALLERIPVRELEYSIETVPPPALRDRAIDAWRKRDEVGMDRLIVHFMQPHVPFRSKPEWFAEWRGTDIWGHARWSDVSDGIGRSDWLAAYRDNLEWVIDEGVAPLRYNVDGEILVTSDHGNAAGEWGVWGHPNGCLVPTVRRVPCLRFPGVDRGQLKGISGASDEWNADEQLAALGYRS